MTEMGLLTPNGVGGGLVVWTAKNTVETKDNSCFGCSLDDDTVFPFLPLAAADENLELAKHFVCIKPRRRLCSAATDLYFC